MYLPCLMCLSLSFLTIYISVLFLCLIFSSLSPLTLSSSICIPSLYQPYLAILYFPYNSFPIIQIILILTTLHTCIDTLVTSCCSLSQIINFNTPCPSFAPPMNLVTLPSTHLTPFVDVCNIPDHLCSLL